METKMQFGTHRPTVQAAEEILGLYFPVLDHGFVSLVDYMGSDDEIERAARVSYGGSAARKKTQTRGLIRYLRRHKHTTPSEMVELKFHCCMPIFIARQWIRHRTANVNEMSGRYTLLPMLFYKPEVAQLQAQSQTNNQGRSGHSMGSDFHQQASERWDRMRSEAQSTYKWLTGNDVAKEIARIDLPVSTYTQWYWKIDLHNLMHFLGLRVDSHAQWEIQQYGKVMAGMMKRIAPLSYEAWIDYDVTGVHFSRQEMEVIRSMVKRDEQAKAFSTYISAVNDVALTERGLGDRELKEFVAKMVEQPVPDFELDLTKAKPGSYFEERFAAAMPKGEQAPST